MYSILHIKVYQVLQVAEPAYVLHFDTCIVHITESYAKSSRAQCISSVHLF